MIKIAKELKIQCTKCTLVIQENELLACLAAKPDLFKKAIGRGKAFRRAEKVQRWQEKQLTSNDEK